MSRLTDEEVERALANADGFLLDALALPEDHEIYAALLQVSADLSAAKAENTRLLQRLPEVALYKLQKAARAVIRHTEGMRLVIGVNCDDDERRAVVADARALRSLLPEDGR